MYLTEFDFLWETCDDGRRCDNEEKEFDEECDEFYIPTPGNLKAYEIPKKLFEPIFEAYSWADHTRCLEYFKCFLRGISELSNTTFTSAMKKELMEIAVNHVNEELTNALANDENFSPLFESKDDLGRTFIQEYLYERRFIMFSFLLR